MEAITGQFYLAVIVAGVVSVLAALENGLAMAFKEQGIKVEGRE